MAIGPRSDKDDHDVALDEGGARIEYVIPVVSLHPTSATGVVVPSRTMGKVFDVDGAEPSLASSRRTRCPDGRGGDGPDDGRGVRRGRRRLHLRRCVRRDARRAWRRRAGRRRRGARRWRRRAVAGVVAVVPRCPTCVVAADSTRGEVVEVGDVGGVVLVMRVPAMPDGRWGDGATAGEVIDGRRAVAGVVAVDPMTSTDVVPAGEATSEAGDE
jgi:hypothetical protein